MRAQIPKPPSGLSTDRTAKFTPAPSGEGLWSAGRADLAPYCGLGELPCLIILRRGLHDYPIHKLLPGLVSD